MKLGIANKINLLAFITITIAAIFLGWFFVWHETEAIREELDERAKTIVSNLVYNSEFDLLVGNKEDLSYLIEGIIREKDVAYVIIEDGEGEIIARSGEKKRDLIKEYKAPVITELVPEGEDELGIITETREQRGEEVIGTVRLGVSLSGLSEKTTQIRRVIYLVVIIVVLISGLGVFLGVRILIIHPLENLISGINRIGAGDLSHRVRVRARDEIGELAGSFNRMTEIVEERTAELIRANEQLRNLSAHLQSIRESERTHIAREIHDELGQTLTALKMDASWLGRRLPDDLRELLGKTESMSKLIDNTIKTVQRISTELRPGILDDLGLIAAMEWQAEEFQDRMEGKCEVVLDLEEIIPDQERSTTIFRIFQEILTNIARHSNATSVEVSLKEKDGIIELNVKDNGRGITEEQIYGPRSLGLIGIRERVRSWGGEFEIKGIKDKGTLIKATIPLKNSHGQTRTQ